MASLPRPYAVIRRVVGIPGQVLSVAGEVIEGDAEQEESDDEEEEDTEDVTPGRSRKRGRVNPVEEEEGPEPPLFEPNPDILPTTPKTRHPPSSSSPIYPPSTARDFSSELDFSSPAREIDEDEDEERSEGMKQGLRKKPAVRKRKRVKLDGERERTRHYEVVGVVRKKVVFALRWVRSSYGIRQQFCCYIPH